jgi:hypothetical protein
MSASRADLLIFKKDLKRDLAGVDAETPKGY